MFLLFYFDKCEIIIWAITSELSASVLSSYARLYECVHFL